MEKVILIIATLLVIVTAIYIYRFKGYKSKETTKRKGTSTGMTTDDTDSYPKEKNQ